MKINSIKVLRETKNLIQLNGEFHDKTLLSKLFYKQLVKFGVKVDECMIVDICPDDYNTYFGRLIRQDGKVFKFDIDLEFEEYSEWTDISEEFYQTVKKFTKVKPWLKEVIAYKMFTELKKDN